MRLRSAASVICLCSVALPPLGWGQMRSPSETYDRHALVRYDVERDGTHWARGPSYKACVNASGFTFLGSDAPRSYPIQFRLHDVKRAGLTFGLTDEAQVLGSGFAVLRQRFRAPRASSGIRRGGVLQAGSLDSGD